MARKTKKLNKAKHGDIMNILDDLRSDDTIFRCDYSQLAKHLFRNYLSVKNIWSADFETIKNAYLENIEFEKKKKSRASTAVMKILGENINARLEEAIKSEKKFYPYICKKYFFLEKEPGKELLQLYINSSKHINEIDSRLKSIENRIQKIETENKVEDLQSIKPIMMHYQIMNIEAKARIQTFVTQEIKQFALNNCYEKIGSSFSNGQLPYAYAWNPKHYEPKIPNDLANKFGDLPIQKFSKINEDYEKRKTKFKGFRTEYIKNSKITDQILQRLNDNHILNERRDLIQDAIKTYLKGSKLMFINAVPTIIEGIFHDLCLLKGEDDNELTRHGFGEKLKRLRDVMEHHLHYEYYAFRFRLLRNKIAHGRLKLDNVNEYADFMLLDLFDVTGMVFIENFELNKKINLVKQIILAKENERNPLLLKYLLLNSVPIDDFYQMKEHMVIVKEFMKELKFWEYLGEQIDKGEEAIHGILCILQILKPLGVDDRSCKDLLKKIGPITLDQQKKELYFKYLS